MITRKVLKEKIVRDMVFGKEENIVVYNFIKDLNHNDKSKSERLLVNKNNNIEKTLNGDDVSDLFQVGYLNDNIFYNCSMNDLGEGIYNTVRFFYTDTLRIISVQNRVKEQDTLCVKTELGIDDTIEGKDDVNFMVCQIIMTGSYIPPIVRIKLISENPEYIKFDLMKLYNGIEKFDYNSLNSEVTKNTKEIETKEFKDKRKMASFKNTFESIYSNSSLSKEKVIYNEDNTIAEYINDLNQIKFIQKDGWNLTYFKDYLIMADKQFDDFFIHEYLGDQLVYKDNVVIHQYKLNEDGVYVDGDDNIVVPYLSEEKRMRRNIGTESTDFTDENNNILIKIINDGSELQFFDKENIIIMKYWIEIMGRIRRYKFTSLSGISFEWSGNWYKDNDCSFILTEDNKIKNFRSMISDKQYPVYIRNQFGVPVLFRNEEE